MSDVHEKLGDDGEYARWIASEARKEGRRRMTETTIEHPALTGSEVAIPAQPVDALTEFASPLGGVARAQQLANVLADIIEKKKLAVSIKGRRHIKIEGWLTLGALCGVTPATEWVKADENGYSSRTQVIRLATGQIIGAAESRCDFSEKLQRKDGSWYDRWDRDEPHSCESMAQTRSASKALAMVLRWIPELAGYAGTPYEEMPRGREEETAPESKRSTQGAAHQPASEPSRPPGQAAPRTITDPQRRRLWALWSKRWEEQGAPGDAKMKEATLRGITAGFGIEHTKDIRMDQYEAICDLVEAWVSPESQPDDPNWDSEEDTIAAQGEL